MKLALFCLKQFGKVKRLGDWVPHEVGVCVILNYCPILFFMQQRIISVGCTWQFVTASTVAGLRHSNATPAPKSLVYLVSAAGLIHCSLWVATKPLPLRNTQQIDEMHQNLQQHSHDQSRAQLSMIMSNHVSWGTGLWSFTSFDTFDWLLAKWLPLLQVSRLLSQRKRFH